MKISSKRKVLKKIGKTIPYIVIIIFIVILFKECKKNDALARNPMFATGTILHFSEDAKGSGGRITYVFKLEGKEYKNVRAYGNIYTSQGYNFVNKSFPVAYEKNNVGNNQLLISPKQFDEINLPFPDSLEWVRKYMKP